MKKLDVVEMRAVEGGARWSWTIWWAQACARARLRYEHSRYGSCYTRYYGLVKCPVCGKR